MVNLPEFIDTEAELDDLLTTPSPELIDDLRSAGGDVLILGAGGKMGPTLAILASRAVRAAGAGQRVIAVSRFSEPGLARQLNDAGVEIIARDLLDEGALDDLPDAPNVVYMAGRKFGSTGAESLTWAMNTYLPALVAGRFRASRLVAFSTGNVYPLVPVASGGATEDLAPAPIGEYAQSCLGRERMIEYASDRYGTRAALLRLNYAIDLRYGILVDVATRILHGEPVDVTMGAVNVIWQGDANAVALRAFRHCANPSLVINVTGPETLSVRYLAHRFAKLLGRPVPELQGEEAPTALLSNAGRMHNLFGYPRVPLGRMIQWVAHWVDASGRTLGKPTHFEEREGRF